VLNTTILKASLLLQNTEEWAGEVHTLGSQSLEEEGGPFGADISKAYTTRSSKTSSEMTPENKCDHIHLFASLQ